jgi:hypothetical protein
LNLHLTSNRELPVLEIAECFIELSAAPEIRRPPVLERFKWHTVNYLTELIFNYRKTI